MKEHDGGNRKILRISSKIIMEGNKKSCKIMYPCTRGGGPGGEGDEGVQAEVWWRGQQHGDDQPAHKQVW